MQEARNTNILNAGGRKYDCYRGRLLVSLTYWRNGALNSGLLFVASPGCHNDPQFRSTYFLLFNYFTVSRYDCIRE
jgi:hypothetical protein